MPQPCIEPISRLSVVPSRILHDFTIVYPSFQPIPQVTQVDYMHKDPCNLQMEWVILQPGRWQINTHFKSCYLVQQKENEK